MRSISTWQYMCSALRFLNIGLATVVTFCALFLTTNTANADDAAIAREADAALKGKNYATALSKYTVLAEKGNTAAQFNVGILYLKGQGVHKDEKQAYDWFKKAAVGGHASAKKFIESSAAKGNVYATAALKELQPATTAQVSKTPLPAKTEVPVVGAPPQSPVKQIADGTPPAPAPTNQLAGKPDSEVQDASKLKQGSSGSSDQKIYAVVDYGRVTLKNIGSDGSNPSSSYRFAAGYKIFPHVAAEAGYLKTGTGSYASGAQNTLYVSSIQGAAVFDYPIFGGLSLLGKLGVSSNTTGGDAVAACNCASSMAFLYGLGAQYQLTKHFGTRIEYTNYGNVTHGATNGDLAMTTLSLGLLYSF